MKNRYRDYNSYLRGIFGERVQKISLDAGFNCPNRDGTVSSSGCIYCDSRGSGSGAMILRKMSIEEQVSSGIENAGKRYKTKNFIVYFQSFTNTYAPVSVLKDLYARALAHPSVAGISIGTRPDCVDNEILELISSYKEKYLVWIEYGLQSAHDSTLIKINRGHDAACFEEAVRITHEYGLNICAHVILGLPGETREMMMETARFLAGMPVSGVKIHSLYVSRGTALADMYERGEFECMGRDEYIDTLIDFLELLPPEYVIQRVTGDPHRNELVAPEWTLEKSLNLMLIKQRLEERDTWQGKRYRNCTAGTWKSTN